MEPTYAKQASKSRFDPFAEKLPHLLETEAGKICKQRRTLKQMYSELVALGYDGSCDCVAAFALDWAIKRQEAKQTAGRGTFVPLVFDAGEAFQFDWSEDWAVLSGERTWLQVEHFKISRSRAFYVRVYLLQTHEMLFDAHNHAVRVFGGVPRRGIYDNMKTAVDKVLSVKARDVKLRRSLETSAGCLELWRTPFQRDTVQPSGTFAGRWHWGAILRPAQSSWRRSRTV